MTGTRRAGARRDGKQREHERQREKDEAPHQPFTDPPVMPST